MYTIAMDVALNTGKMSNAIAEGEFTQLKRVGESVDSIPKNRIDLHNDLLDKGYRCNGTSGGGYITYMRDDGMRVDIRPNGEIITTKKNGYQIILEKLR